MTPPPPLPWAGLPTDPGLCRACRHPLLNQTRRGSVFLRCGRASWDEALPRYPRLPVTACPGFEPRPPGAEAGASRGVTPR